MNGIEVEGIGVVTAPPDLARMRVSAEGHGASPERAFEYAREHVQTYRSALEAAGMSRFSTDRPSLSPNQEWDGKRHVRRGYLARITIIAEFDDVADVEGAMARLAAADAENVGKVQYTTSRTDLESRARARAIDDAKMKAREYAKAAGVTVGRVLAIHEPPRITHEFQEDRYAAMGEMAEPEPTLEPAELAVRVRVRVAFEIE